MQNINQFKQSVEKGSLDLAQNNNIFPAQVDDAQVTPLVAGQKVILATTVGGIIKVLALPNDATEFFGVVAYSLKKVNHAAGEGVQIAGHGSVIHLEAGAAVVRSAKVMAVIVGEKAITATVGKIVIGLALDGAAADGDMFRVLVADGMQGLVA